MVHDVGHIAAGEVTLVDDDKYPSKSTNLPNAALSAI